MIKIRRILCTACKIPLLLIWDSMHDCYMYEGTLCYFSLSELFYWCNAFFITLRNLFILFPAPRTGSAGDDVDFARPSGAPKTAKRAGSAPVGKGRSSSLSSSKGISSGKIILYTTNGNSHSKICRRWKISLLTLLSNVERLTITGDDTDVIFSRSETYLLLWKKTDLTEMRSSNRSERHNAKLDNNKTNSRLRVRK